MLVEDEVLVLIYMAWRKYQLPEGSMYDEASAKVHLRKKRLPTSSRRLVTLDKVRLFPHVGSPIRLSELKLPLFRLQLAFHDNN